MSQQGFTDLLKRIFSPRNVSTDILRQSYVTYEVTKMNSDEAKKVAKIMGHLIVTQQMIYKKYII